MASSALLHGASCALRCPLAANQDGAAKPAALAATLECAGLRTVISALDPSAPDIVITLRSGATAAVMLLPEGSKEADLADPAFVKMCV